MGSRDFSKKRKEITFTLEGPGSEQFRAVDALAAGVVLDLGEKYGDLQAGALVSEQIRAVRVMMDDMLEPESLERFNQRLYDKTRPVDVEQLMEILDWLLEEFGLRPTQPSTSSSSGPPLQEPGTTLTASTPDGGSTYEVSLSTAS